MKTERAFQVIRTWFMAPYKRRTEAPNKHCQRKRFLSLLAGVDTSLTGEHIHKLLSVSEPCMQPVAVAQYNYEIIFFRSEAGQAH